MRRNNLFTPQKEKLDASADLETSKLALENADHVIGQAIRRARFWDAHAQITFNDRQRRVLLCFMEPFEGKLTTSKYAKLAKCSGDTALRDLKELVSLGILGAEGIGRGTHYVWNQSKWPDV